MKRSERHFVPWDQYWDKERHYAGFAETIDLYWGRFGLGFRRI